MQNTMWFLWPVACSFAGSLLALVVFLLFLWWWCARYLERVMREVNRLVERQETWYEDMAHAIMGRIHELAERLQAQPDVKCVGVTFSGHNVSEATAQTKILLGERISIGAGEAVKVHLRTQQLIQLDSVHIANGEQVWVRLMGVGPEVLFAAATPVPLDADTLAELLPLVIEPGDTLWLELEWKP